MKPQAKSRSFSEYVLLVLKGFCMGASDVVPGVSGGTMAFILGIYEELISSIRSFDLKSLRYLATFKFRSFINHVSWQFLLALGTGILAAILTLARTLSWLLENEPVLVWSFFFGLIVASALCVGLRVNNWRSSNWFCLVSGAVGAYFFVGLVPVSTPEENWFLFICGALAICAMILPGISGSFVLVLMGKYHYVLNAVNDRNLIVLAVVAAGACTGIAVFSRILGWLLRNYHDHMVALLTGLMLGSLRKVWPWKETSETLIDGRGGAAAFIEINIMPNQWDTEILTALFMMLAGFFVVISLDRLAARKR